MQIFLLNAIQLIPDGSIVIHILIILLMILVLNRTLFSPIHTILENRERRTRGKSREAADILSSIDERISSYETALRSARAEAYALIERERTNALDERKSRIDETRSQLQSQIQEQRQLIERQTRSSIASLEEETRKLGLKLGSKVLGRSLV
jgi:F-type H+-transporting ATPase subunit b